MLCPKCKYPDSHVIRTSRDYDDIIIRQRECIKCGMRYKTQENLKESRKESHQ
jgi:transcriptional regulator NrdR family protein